MSWSFKHVGTRAGVAAAVQKELYLPQEIKDLVARIAGTLPKYDNGLSVESSGHVDEYSGNVSALKIESIKVESDPPSTAPDYRVALSPGDFAEYENGRTIALSEKPLPEGASAATVLGFNSVPSGQVESSAPSPAKAPA